MAITFPPHFSESISLTDTAGTASVAGRIIKLPQQAKQEREAARARRAQQPPSRPYTPFFIPQCLLDDRERHTRQQQSTLLQLPIEILLLIVEKVGIPYFQVVLGLTCKSLAEVLANNRERLAPWRGFRDKEGLYRLLTRVPPQNGKISPYIPDTLRLCRACFRHVPRSKTYWLDRLSSADLERPHVNYFDILNFFGESARKCGQHKCPECCVRNNTCFMSGTEYQKALAEDYRDEEVYLIDFGEEGRRVCDELPGRIGRP